MSATKMNVRNINNVYYGKGLTQNEKGKQTPWTQ